MRVRHGERESDETKRERVRQSERDKTSKGETKKYKHVYKEEGIY